MKKLLIPAALAAVATLSLAAPSSAVFGSPAPVDADPFMSVSTQGGTFPLSVKVTNMRQFEDRTAIVVSSATPAVCQVSASLVLGTYQTSAAVPVTVTGHGTCTIQADQAASVRYLAGHTERSYSV